MDRTHPAPVNHNRLIIRLLVMVAAAFAFAFALVPLYNVLCRVTGFNGKVTGEKTIRDGFGVGGLKTDKVPTSNIDLGRIFLSAGKPVTLLRSTAQCPARSFG